MFFADYSIDSGGNILYFPKHTRGRHHWRYYSIMNSLRRCEIPRTNCDRRHIHTTCKALSAQKEAADTALHMCTIRTINENSPGWRLALQFTLKRDRN